MCCEPKHCRSRSRETGETEEAVRSEKNRDELAKEKDRDASEVEKDPDASAVEKHSPPSRETKEMVR